MVSVTLFSPASPSGLSSSASWPLNMEFPRDHPCTSLSMTSSLAISCLYITLQTKPTSVSLALTSLISILLAGQLYLKLSISNAEVIFLTRWPFFSNSLFLSTVYRLLSPSAFSSLCHLSAPPKSTHLTDSLTTVSPVSSFLSISGQHL